eukprot:359853-Chlamydomonas_euryale.AAC.21
MQDRLSITGRGGAGGGRRPPPCTSSSKRCHTRTPHARARASGDRQRRGMPTARASPKSATLTTLREMSTSTFCGGRASTHTAAVGAPPGFLWGEKLPLGMKGL